MSEKLSIATAAGRHSVVWKNRKVTWEHMSSLSKAVSTLFISSLSTFCRRGLFGSHKMLLAMAASHQSLLGRLYHKSERMGRN